MKFTAWLGATLMLVSPVYARAKDDPETHDLRCLVSYMAVVADQDSNARQDAKISASFFVGRIMNRNPSIDLTESLDRVLSMGMPNEAVRLACSNDLAALAPRMTVAFANLRGRLPQMSAK